MGMGECGQGQVMSDVGPFSILAAQELPARRQIEEQLAHLDRGTRGRGGGLHLKNLSPVDQDLTRLARRLPELPLVGETGFPEEVVEELQESWAPMVDDAAAQAEDFVQDQVEDITEQAQDTLGGIADDLGL